jgi:hypothetical protein
MGKRDTDKLKEYILWAIEAYNVAADPPALNYSKQIDPSFRDDVNAYSRAYLLRLSIDVKHALNGLLVRIPLKRAQVLIEWITGTQAHYWHSLTHKQQFFLKIDRKLLSERIRGMKQLANPGHNEG